MLSSKELQKKYVDLYKAMREYVWEYRTAEYLAELEIAVFTTFPDMQTIRNTFNKLYLDIRDALTDDEEFKNAVDGFKELIETDDTLYAKLDTVSEVN